MTLQIKLIILAIVSASFLGLGWTAKHYHDKFIEVTAQVAAIQVSLNTATAAAEKCLENTRKLAEAADKKQREVEEAQKVAEAASRKKQGNATSILIREPSLPADLCKSTEELFKQYKKDMAGK